MGRKLVRKDELPESGGLLSFPRTGCALLRSGDFITGGGADTTVAPAQIEAVGRHEFLAFFARGATDGLDAFEAKRLNVGLDRHALATWSPDLLPQRPIFRGGEKESSQMVERRRTKSDKSRSCSDHGHREG